MISILPNPKSFISLFILGLFAFSLHGQSLKPGDKAPEISQKLITGEDFHLSDLRGKLVLIDFWAAWCAPCRKANPEMVELYHEYKDKEFDHGNGFAIVSVSLDFKQEMWKEAIENDNLDWPYHVGGTSGWKNPAVEQYQVKQIPTGFLIDGEGTIIEVNLRGDKLEKALKKEQKRRFFFF